MEEFPKAPVAPSAEEAKPVVPKAEEPTPIAPVIEEPKVEGSVEAPMIMENEVSNYDLRKYDLVELERLFTPEEVYAQIEQLEGVQRSDFTSIEHRMHSSGALARIYLKLKPEASMKKFNNMKGYAFLLGMVRKDNARMTTTQIHRVDFDASGEEEFAVNIAEFVNGAWVRKE